MKVNLKGCKPTEDVCLKHDEPLLCKHGCSQAIDHKCLELVSLLTKELKKE